jgi:hypothetical protein
VTGLAKKASTPSVSVCVILGIDYTKKVQTPDGRPFRIVDTGAQPVGESIG